VEVEIGELLPVGWVFFFFFFHQLEKIVFCGFSSFQIMNVQFLKVTGFLKVLVGSENDRKMLNFCHFFFVCFLF
jgi:hypothetical protein